MAGSSNGFRVLLSTPMKLVNFEAMPYLRAKVLTSSLDSWIKPSSSMSWILRLVAIWCKNLPACRWQVSSIGTSIDNGPSGAWAVTVTLLNLKSFSNVLKCNILDPSNKTPILSPPFSAFFDKSIGLLKPSKVLFFWISSFPFPSLSFSSFHRTWTLVKDGINAFFNKVKTLGLRSSCKVAKIELPLPARATPLTKCREAEAPKPKVKTLELSPLFLTKLMTCWSLLTAPSVSKKICLA